VLFLHNTSASPRHTALADEKHPRLLSEKGFGGFPTVCFMDASGNVLAKLGKRDMAGVTETMGKAKHVAGLRAKGDKATPAEQKELLMTELKEGLVKLEDIQPRADKLALTPEEKVFVTGKIVDLEVADLAMKSRGNPQELGAKFAAMLKDGKAPSDENTMFWQTVLRHASTEKDAELAQRAFDVLAKRPNAPERQKQGWQKMLDEAKAK
jgi:hypothetical protein